MSLCVTTALAIRFTQSEYLDAFYQRVSARTCWRAACARDKETIDTFEHAGDRGFELSGEPPSGPILCNCRHTDERMLAVWAYVPTTSALPRLESSNDASSYDALTPQPMSSYAALRTTPADVPGATLHVTKSGAVYLCLVSARGNAGVCDTAVFDEDMLAAVNYVDQLRRRTKQAYALRIVSWCTLATDLDA